MKPQWLLIAVMLCGFVTHSFAQGASDIHMEGVRAYDIGDGELTLAVERIVNPRPLGTYASSLDLSLWATANPFGYSGNPLDGCGGFCLVGHRLGSVQIGGLDGGYLLQNVVRTTSFTEPPPGNYNWFLFSPKNSMLRSVVD